jgi:hypothetical protein
MMRYVSLGSMLLVLLGGCATPLTPRESGTLAGATVGAATGAILGGIAGSTGKGAAIGAAVGAVTGALTGEAIQRERAAAWAYAREPVHAPPPYRHSSPYAWPPETATSALQIEVTPGETEIVIDGRRIGMARDFHGPANVPVAAGPHVVEFRWDGFSVTSHAVAPFGATIPIRRDLAPSASLLAPRPSSGAERPLSR